MDKRKKVLIIGGSIEAAILLIALILSIIVWSTAHTQEQAAAAGMTLPDYNIAMNGGFIGFFQNNTTAFFLLICVPIFAIIGVDIVYLAIVASKKESKLTDEQLKAIKKKAEAQVREEIMKEMLAQEALEEKPEAKEEK